MIIAREDLNQMKDLARRMSVTPNWETKRLYEMQHDFRDRMAEKYGEKAAIAMLTKAWKLSARMRLEGEI